MLRPTHPDGFRKLQLNRGIEVQGNHLRLYWNGDDGSTPTHNDNLITVVLTDEDTVWLIQQLLGLTEDKDET